mgnify:CR=1 FL=1
MTNLEFISVMKALRIEEKEIDEKKRYFIDDIEIKYCDDGKVVFDNLPLDVETSLYDDCTDFVKEIIEICSTTKYCVSTKEELIEVIYKIKKYYNPLLEVIIDNDEIDRCVSNVDDKVIEDIIPSISINEWMKYDKENNESYMRTVSKSKNSIFLDLLRSAINSFDKAVNPYMAYGIQLDNFYNYKNRVNIECDFWDEENELGYRRNNCCKMTITDIKTNNVVTYERNINGFSCSLDYMTNDGRMIMVKHSYNGNSENSYDRGEVISIKSFEHGKETQLNYNITKDKVFEYSNKTGKVETKPIKLKQKIDLYWDLVTAVSYAEEVSVKNMVIDEPGKILEIK